MAASSNGGDDDLITAINVTPLVDVVLVLLIILMVSANQLAANRQIPMELPEADSGDPEQRDEPTTLRVSIVPDGTLYLDGEAIEVASLRDRIRTARTESEDVRAVIAADGAVEHRQVVRVIDLLRREDVVKFAINVRPSELAPE